MYDSTIGRWLGEDPIGFDAGAMNLAEYVGNGPTNATDPTGLVQWDTARPDPKNPGDLIVTLDDGKTTIRVVKDPAGRYQCHSLTFGADKCKGGPYNVGGESIDDLIVGDGYTHIPAALAKPGDIVVWRDSFGEGKGDVVHTGVLDEVRFNAEGKLDQDKTMVRQKPGAFKPEEKVPFKNPQQVQYGGGYFVYRKGPVDLGGKTYPRNESEWPVPAIHNRDADAESFYGKADPYFGKKK